MFLVFSIIHFRESNQILKDIIYNDDNLCLQKGGVERKKTQDANLSLLIKNPNPLLKYGFRIRIWIPKLAKNWADSGFWIRIRIANPRLPPPSKEKSPLPQHFFIFIQKSEIKDWVIEF